MIYEQFSEQLSLSTDIELGDGQIATEGDLLLVLVEVESGISSFEDKTLSDAPDGEFEPAEAGEGAATAVAPMPRAGYDAYQVSEMEHQRAYIVKFQAGAIRQFTLKLSSIAGKAKISVAKFFSNIGQTAIKNKCKWCRQLVGLIIGILISGGGDAIMELGPEEIGPSLLERLNTDRFALIAEKMREYKLYRATEQVLKRTHTGIRSILDLKRKLAEEICRVAGFCPKRRGQRT